MNRSRHSFISVLALGALTLAACGGDDDVASVVSSADASGAAASTTPGDEVTTTVAGAEDTPTEDATAATTGEAIDPADLGESADGDPDSPYCQAIRGELDMPADFGAMGDVDFTDPEAMEEMLADAESSMAQTVSIAPESLRADFQAVLEASFQMVTQMAENDGDMTAIDMSAMETPEFEAAAARVDAYNVDVCGFDATAELGSLPDDVDATDMTATLEAMLAPLKTQLNLTDEQVSCLSEGISSSMTESGAAPDMAAVMGYFAECGIDATGG